MPFPPPPLAAHLEAQLSSFLHHDEGDPPDAITIHSPFPHANFVVVLVVLFSGCGYVISVWSQHGPGPAAAARIPSPGTQREEEGQEGQGRKGRENHGVGWSYNN